MKWLLLALLSVSAYAGNEECLLKGSYSYDEDAKLYEKKEDLFYGFENIFDDTEEVNAAIKEYFAQSALVQKLIYTARTESETTGIFFDQNNPSFADLVSYMDYMAIDTVEYANPKTNQKDLLYLVDIAVGGGNGAYLYYVKDQEGDFQKVYEDFDGDLYFCAEAYLK